MKSSFRRFAFCLLAVVCLSLSGAVNRIVAQEAAFEAPLGLPPIVEPKDNRLSPEKVELGKLLYFDPRLSEDHTISCASCHDPAKGWSNGERFASGVRGQMGGRSAPTILNSGYFTFQFWDGRALHVEGQALGPIQNEIEMNMKLGDVVARIGEVPEYEERFAAVFPDGVTEQNIAKAIGAFERTINSGNAPFDRWKAGDKTALSPEAERGRALFFGKANCSACHSGPHFSDGAFHNIGVGMDDPKPDLGRFVVSKLGGDTGAFKTPTLREVARTAPYMHDGRFATLEEVVQHYNKGGTPNEYLDEEIFELNLSDQEAADLVTFMKEGLASPDYPLVEPPKLP
ncbi:MAG TPA: cytochrome c peroxidase [Pirellulaceae bacterium]|jgi:cytochrome c peroxidase|nr:cytochrome c peroxidase [Pirellulaceae bacterium]